MGAGGAVRLDLHPAVGNFAGQQLFVRTARGPAPGRPISTKSMPFFHQVQDLDFFVDGRNLLQKELKAVAQ